MLPIENLSRPPSWWAQPAPGREVLFSTRVRLARNLAGVPFLLRADAAVRAEVVERLRRALAGNELTRSFAYADFEKLEANERLILLERNLASRDLVEGEGPRGLFLSPGEGASVMVNEEDHVRIQSLKPGLSLEWAWEEADAIDDLLEEETPFAFREDLGYLTACPSNLGTGLRASVLMHLPGLVITRRMEKVFRAVTEAGFAVRGMHGEGSEPVGHFFQVSNQRTLGKPEARILADLAELARQIEDYEKKARQHLLEKDALRFADRIHRAWGILTSARMMSSTEAIMLLSALRMGSVCGLIEKAEPDRVDHLLTVVQPAHLQYIGGREMDDQERDHFRADFIARHLLS